MLTAYNMVYFGGRWEGLLYPGQQLMSVFSRQNKVLFIEMRSDFRSTLDRFRRGDLVLSDLYRTCVHKVSENLYVFRYPVWAPVSERFLLQQLGRTVGRYALQSALRRLQMSQPIVWFYHPEWVDLVNEIPSASLTLYHIIDEYTSYLGDTWSQRRRIEEREKKMMAQVDAMVVVSEKLYESKHPFNANTYLVPNGVNYQAYNDALANPYIPKDLQVIKPPRLGYSGLIGDRLNLSMLKNLARENPEWSLVFLGHVNTSEKAETWQALRALPNVHYLGSVEWSQVPQYVKGFDVGLMPYVQDRHSETISPLKLYDYLAAGLPIAAIDIPAVRAFSSHIHLASGPENFACAVRTALTDTTPERRQARREAAAQHAWEVRAEQLSELIRDQLIAKASA